MISLCINLFVLSHVLYFGSEIYLNLNLNLNLYICIFSHVWGYMILVFTVPKNLLWKQCKGSQDFGQNVSKITWQIKCLHKWRYLWTVPDSSVSNSNLIRHTCYILTTYMSTTITPNIVHYLHNNTIRFCNTKLYNPQCIKLNPD